MRLKIGADIIRVCRVGRGLVGRAYKTARGVFYRRVLVGGYPTLPVVGRVAAVQNVFSLVGEFQREFALGRNGDVVIRAGENKVLRGGAEISERLAVIVIIAGAVQVIKGFHVDRWIVRYPPHGCAN